MASSLAVVRARELFGAARSDHRESQRLKRRSRERMRDLEAFCRRNGIELELVTKSEEDTVNGSEATGS